MDAQPVDLPRWGNVRAGAIVEPSEDRKDDGWELNVKPEHQYQNWLHDLTYQWLKWLRDKNNFGVNFDSPYLEITYDSDDKITDVDYYESSAKVTHMANLGVSYDSDDKITTAALSITGGSTFTSTIAYDANDRVSTITTVES